jgi:signal recognition particle subunit SRP68
MTEPIKNTQNQKFQKNEKDTLLENTAVEDQPIRLDILLTTTNLQNQNGIRLNDYGRYAKFCGTKINKLRKILKITQGKRKFNKIDITPEITNDSRFLLILILNCERKWATGMAIKQQLTSIGQDIKPLRYSIKKKLKKAAEVSKQILEIAKIKCDTQTILEAEAYYNYSQANYFLFLRKFQEALDLFKISAKIYENFTSMKDSIEAINFRERINAIKSSIRLCVYNINVFLIIIYYFHHKTYLNPCILIRYLIFSFLLKKILN